MVQLNFSEITVPILLLWGIGLGAFILGMLLGSFSSRLRASEKIEAAEQRVEVMRAEAEKKLAEAELLKSQAPRVVDDPGLLRLKNKDGRPYLEMNGVALDVKNVSADQKKRLIELLSVIRPWIEGGQAVPPVPVQPTTMPPTVAPQPASPPLERASVQQAATPLTPSPTQPLPTVAAQALAEKEFKALSIIAQIDHVFQRRIAGTAYETMGIRIFEGTVGSVEVMVGLNRYPSIDDVPDAEIKKAIRDAIAEWEQKYAGL